MYNITKETTSESQYKTFGAGIHANVTLESVEFKVINDKVNNGEPVLIFNFVGANGEKLGHIEYPAETTTDPAKAAGFAASRIKHILARFIPEDEIVLSGSNYAEFSNAVIALLGTNNIGKKVAIKLTYGTKSYPKKRVEFPKFPDFIALLPSGLSIKADDLMNPVTAVPTNVEEDLTSDLGAEDLVF